jgi:lincosamide nucleotidyltransferase B/F
LDRKAQLLARLDAIGESLKNTGDALALLGLGSVGVETARLDAYSDLDFFAIVKTGCKQWFIDDLGWLSVIHPVVYTFRNTVDGYKLLFEDDIFCEFAVFEPQELAAIPFAGGRVVWQDASFDASLTAPRSQPTHAERSLEFSLEEALTNLYVGLGRFWRGEKLSAARFIQQYAVDHILTLSQYIEAEQPAYKDVFNPERRYEERFPGAAAHLPGFIQGYYRSPESARAILTFLDQHFAVNPAIKARILHLCDRSPGAALSASP